MLDMPFSLSGRADRCNGSRSPGVALYATSTFHRFAANRYSDFVRIGAVVIRCYEFEKMFAFWQEALHYRPREPARDGWVVLCDPSGRGPNLSLDRHSKPREGARSWLHLDLYTDDQKNEVERLLSLGAQRYPWRYQPANDFVVLADPDGNLFCVVARASDQAQTEPESSL
jgi:catechol 2,3-dioxygenase-like lactoylglutathione lyase family enzyme